MKGKITNFRFAIRIASSLIHVNGKEILGYDDTALFGIYSLNASDSDNFCQFIILNMFIHAFSYSKTIKIIKHVTVVFF